MISFTLDGTKHEIEPKYCGGGRKPLLDDIIAILNEKGKQHIFNFIADTHGDCIRVMDDCVYILKFLPLRNNRVAIYHHTGDNVFPYFTCDPQYDTKTFKKKHLRIHPIVVDFQEIANWYEQSVESLGKRMARYQNPQ